MKQIYLKSLLLMLMMCVGMGAWATTVTKTISDVVSEKSYTVSSGSTINTKCLSIDLDANINVSVAVKEGATGNTGTFWGTSPNIDWRLYQGDEPTITVSAGDGYTISSVKFTYSNSNTGVINTSGHGQSIANAYHITSGTAYDVNAVSATYYIGNTSTKTNGQARITAIEVVYSSTSGDPTPEPTKYDITIANDIANGTVTASPTSAAKGEEIALTATPAKGYEFGSWSVTDASSNSITVTDNKFKMPAANVNVSATFKEEQSGETEEGTTATWVASEQGYTNGVQYTSATVDNNISLAFGDGGNDGKYYETGTGIRIYSNGKMTVSAANNGTISKIVITYSATDYTGTFCANTGDYELSSTIGAWTGSASSVVLTNTASSGHARVQKIVVTYTGGNTPDVTLSSIAVSGTPEPLWIGEEFSHDGITVTATYTDKSTKNVTSEATFSGYDMSKAGEQTIIVSYAEGGITKTDTYTLTVNKAPFVPTPVAEGYETVDFITLEPYKSLDTNGSADMATYEGTSFSAEFAKKVGTNNAPKYYKNGNAVRCYVDNTITITGAENITNVDIAWVKGYVDDAVSITGLGTTTAVVTFSKTCRFTSIAVDYRSTSITIASACTDGDKCYSTYSNASSWVVPANLTVSEIGVNDGRLNVVSYETGDVVPANTGVMVSATEGGYYTVALTTNAGAHPEGVTNALHPSSEPMTGDNLFYRLTMHNGETIGYWWGAENGAAFTLAANKAYLAVPKNTEVKSNFWFSGETAISAPVVKMENEMIYNLNGQRVSSATKGLYIKNGKKYLVK